MKRLGEHWTTETVPTFADAKHEYLAEFQLEYHSRLLELTGGNVSAAARLAGLDRTNFRRLMRPPKRHTFKAPPEERSKPGPALEWTESKLEAFLVIGKGNIAAAARAAGVSYRTVWKRMRNPKLSQSFRDRWGIRL